MSDLIDRQAAIRWVKTECNPYGKPTLDFESGKKVIEHLKQMPPAERKKGKWVRIEDENGDFLCWECSKCGDRYVMPYHRASYYPNCGAEMRGDKDE